MNYEIYCLESKSCYCNQRKYVWVNQRDQLNWEKKNFEEFLKFTGKMKKGKNQDNNYIEQLVKKAKNKKKTFLGCLTKWAVTIYENRD